MNTLFKFDKFAAGDLLEMFNIDKEFIKMESNDFNNIKIDAFHIQEIFKKYEQFRFGFDKLNGDRISFNSKKHGITVITSDNNDSLYSLVMRVCNLSHLRYITRNLSKYVTFSTPNASDMDYWKMKEVPIPNPMIYIPEFSFTDSDYKVLSLEHIPSHAHYMSYGDDLIFEACWQMYFGEIYYKYIPKPLFDAFIDCEENVILEHGIRRITLYQDPQDFGTPHATARQWAFRRQLGIDSIGHELTYNSNRIEPTDLPVLITKKDCLEGTTRVIRFLDASDKLVSPTKAVKKEIKEYLDDGITIVFEELTEINNAER